MKKTIPNELTRPQYKGIALSQNPKVNRINTETKEANKKHIGFSEVDCRLNRIKIPFT